MFEVHIPEQEKDMWDSENIKIGASLLFCEVKEDKCYLYVP